MIGVVGDVDFDHFVELLVAFCCFDDEDFSFRLRGNGCGVRDSFGVSSRVGCTYDCVAIGESVSVIVIDGARLMIEEAPRIELANLSQNIRFVDNGL